MTKPKSGNPKSFKKVVYEVFTIKPKQGGGLVKMEAWEDAQGNLVKYNLAYINPAIGADDNGRVLGYDNAHNYHHQHYLGNIYPVEDFSTYEEIVNRFETELKEFIQ